MSIQFAGHLKVKTDPGSPLVKSCTAGSFVWRLWIHSSVIGGGKFCRLTASNLALTTGGIAVPSH